MYKELVQEILDLLKADPTLAANINAFYFGERNITKANTLYPFIDVSCRMGPVEKTKTGRRLTKRQIDFLIRVVHKHVDEPTCEKLVTDMTEHVENVLDVNETINELVETSKVIEVSGDALTVGDYSIYGSMTRLRAKTHHMFQIFDCKFDTYIKGGDADYNTARDLASGDTLYNSTTSFICGQTKEAFAYWLQRAFIFFDTSHIPDDAVITRAWLILTCVGDELLDEDFIVTVQNGQPTYPHDPPVLSDYNRTYYSGDGGSWNTADYSGNNKVVNIILNATGRGWINKTGDTKLCLRSSKDINGVAPTLFEAMVFHSIEATNKTYHPKLFVEYY